MYFFAVVKCAGTPYLVSKKCEKNCNVCNYSEHCDGAVEDYEDVLRNRWNSETNKKV